MSAISVCDVTLSYDNLTVAEHVSFDIEFGDYVCIVGENGTGKSTLLKAAMGLLGSEGCITGGDIRYKGKHLPSLPPKELRKLNGAELGYIFQSAGSSFCPIRTVGTQLYETMKEHRKISKADFNAQALDLLARLGFENGDQILKSYPFELSGGMRQRIMIAMALVCNPELLICDEPTTALDVTIQGQILDIIKNLQKKNQTSVIMITHDLGVVANIAQKIAVMYSGIIVESGTCEDIFYRPRHPYTWALIRSVPRLDLKNKQELATIPGTPPDLLNPPVGCPFCTRCSYCMPICKEEMPEVTEFGGEHKAACWLHHPMAPKVEMPNLEGGEL